MTHQAPFSVFKALNVIVGLLLLSACTTPSTNKPNNEIEDYCKDINFKRKTTLSEQIAPYSAQLENHKTGVYVLDQGTEAMFTRAWLSEYAQETIDVQYFIFTTDNIGLIAIDYLVRAADRGVKVRILIDDIMLNADSKELLVLNAHPNISIKIYNPLANVGKNIVQKLANLTFHFHAFNQRMHNKTFTVDNSVSITGGRNIADEYFGYDHEYNFRDRDVLLVGEAPKQIQKSFNQFWDDELSVPVTQLLKSSVISNPQPNFEKLHQYACNPINFLPEVREQIAMMPLAFSYAVNHGQVHWLENVEYISDPPGKNDGKTFLGGSGIATDRLITLIQQAKHSVTIQTPYLITTDLGKGILKALVDRGVEVKILTNSLASNDNFEAFSGYQRDRKKLLQTGVKIFEFKPDAKIRQKVMSKEMSQQLAKDPIFTLHAKSMVIDDNITVIGTFNLDPRSANLNTESITIIPSQKISQKMKATMEAEMSADNAWETTLDWNPDGEVNLSKRLKVKSRLFVPKSIL
ncbi:phospholipase D family protein [Psychromonas algicola]|uniref:phospholipase D family protein n=1 Tax=Psychromonas algicola TaxID=2555642 RepID=UPI00106747CF|nr:phospholipase D family protein [Psychromonas sp. RZ5]TEW43550.1 phospholipase D family protein [Psychromonas sp. RZ5]